MTILNRMLTTATLVGLLMLMIFPQARAQVNPSSLVSAIPGGTAANYTYAKPGDLTILVNVWGFVLRPGRYEISNSIDLVHLISLAGGPSEQARLDNVKITRFNPQGSDLRKTEFTIDLEHLTKLKEGDVKLEPGDVIYVDRSTWSIWRDVFSVTTTVAVLVAAFANILNVLQR